MDLLPGQPEGGQGHGVNTMLKELSETDGFTELKGDELRASGPHSPGTRLPEIGGDAPVGARRPRDLWHLPDILTPLQHMNYISVSANADRLPRVVRKDRSERAAVGIAMGDLIRLTVAPALLDCGARQNTIHWCSVDDLRYLIRTVADPEHAADRPPGQQGRSDRDLVRGGQGTRLHHVDSCVARTYWIYQWPDFDVEAGWIRELVTERRMMRSAISGVR